MQFDNAMFFTPRDGRISQIIDTFDLVRQDLEPDRSALLMGNRPLWHAAGAGEQVPRNDSGCPFDYGEARSVQHRPGTPGPRWILFDLMEQVIGQPIHLPRLARFA